jgi:hypothetical protein
MDRRPDRHGAPPSLSLSSAGIISMLARLYTNRKHGPDLRRHRHWRRAQRPRPRRLSRARGKESSRARTKARARRSCGHRGSLSRLPVLRRVVRRLSPAARDHSGARPPRHGLEILPLDGTFTPCPAATTSGVSTITPRRGARSSATRASTRGLRGVWQGDGRHGAVRQADLLAHAARSHQARLEGALELLRLGRRFQKLSGRTSTTRSS